MQRRSEESRKSQEELTQRQQKALSPRVRAYLHGRGISDEAIERYRLGEGVDNHAGLVAIPYLTKLGGVVGQKYRQIVDGRDPKYISEGPVRLYNTLAFEEADLTGLIAIAEGEFDALVLSECGIPAVGIPGVDTWKARREWRELFRGYQHVLFFRDDDEPGSRIAEQVARDLEGVRIVTLPEKDVTDTYVRHGRGMVLAAAGLN